MVSKVLAMQAGTLLRSQHLHKEQDLVMKACNLSVLVLEKWRQEDTWNSRTGWPTSLAESVSFGFSKRPRQDEEGCRKTSSILLWPPHEHTHTFIFMHHMHTKGTCMGVYAYRHTLKRR